MLTVFWWCRWVPKKFSVEPENNFKRISVIMGDKNTFRHPRARIMVDLYFFHNKKLHYYSTSRRRGLFWIKLCKIIYLLLATRKITDKDSKWQKHFIGKKVLTVLPKMSISGLGYQDPKEGTLSIYHMCSLHCNFVMWVGLVL